MEKKKGELARLETNISDMEATHKRKDREFARLRRNLLGLLEEQQTELTSLRERGVELETATATSAAAAAATAQAARENEKRSAAMFASTEELLKFQFMSMSLSYFRRVGDPPKHEPEPPAPSPPAKPQPHPQPQPQP